MESKVPIYLYVYNINPFTPDSAKKSKFTYKLGNHLRFPSGSQTFIEKETSVIHKPESEQR